MTNGNTKIGREFVNSLTLDEVIEIVNALEKIKVLMLGLAENFENGDDEVSHFLENLYDVLDEVIPM